MSALLYIKTKASYGIYSLRWSFWYILYLSVAKESIINLDC